MKIKFTGLIISGIIAGGFSLSANAQIEANAAIAKEAQATKSHLNEIPIDDYQQNLLNIELRADTKAWPDSTITYTASGEKNRKTIYEYDAGGNKTTSISYNWENNDWAVNYKYEYEYDNGLISVSYYFRWDGNSWIMSSKKVYTYNSDGNEIKNTQYIWQNDKWTESLTSMSNIGVDFHEQGTIFSFYFPTPTYAVIGNFVSSKNGKIKSSHL